MHTDAQRLEDGSLIEGDLCIVGAGAAGISMALEWVGQGRKVLLLEGGGFDPDPRMQDLYRGEIVEQPDWVPHSGWPIRRAELDPFYARAQRLLDLGPYEYGADYWGRQEAGRARLPLDGEVVWTKMWQFSPPTRFGRKYRDA